jgi:hypothetical protein
MKDLHKKTKKNRKVKDTKNDGRNMKAKSEFIVEFKGYQFNEKQIINLFKEEWKNTRKLSEIENLSISFKVEENTAYCLVNNVESVVIPYILND